MSTTDTLSERKPDYSRLTQAEVAAVLSLHRAGKLEIEIAAALGCNVSTVSRWLSRLSDTTELAKQTLRAGSQILARRVIEKANVEESLEVLDSLDVLVRRRVDNTRAGVVVVVNQPGQTAFQPPVNIISNYRTRTELVGQQAQALTGGADSQAEAKVEGESD